MSKILLVATRNRSGIHAELQNNLERFSRRLIPDVIIPNETRVVNFENLSYYVFNPVNTSGICDHGIYSGKIISHDDSWWKISSGRPDGTYALFRFDEEYLELISDTLASTSIWYYKSKDIFIASTSQRAIIACAKDFSFNEKVIPWMLFSGIIGPDLSWDRRISKLPGSSILRFNRKSWEFSLQSKPFMFNKNHGSYRQNFAELRNVLEDLFSRITLDTKNWLVSLSGGYDSRGIACFLKDMKGLKAVTWGMAESLETKNNDAFIARKLAELLGIEHEYHIVNPSDEHFDKIFERFLTSGEGRIEHIGGYMDGFDLWAKLFNNKISGIVRGDETFGWRRVYADWEPYTTINLFTRDSYENIKKIRPGILDIPEQHIPEYLKREKEDTLIQWSDRVYSLYRVPCFLASLNELKLSFVDIFNPYLTEKVVLFARSLPDKDRVEKNLFKDLVRQLSPSVPFTGHEAILLHQGVSF